MTSIGAPRARNIDRFLTMFAGSSYNDTNSYNCSTILELIALACSCRSSLRNTIQFKASVWLKWSGVLSFIWTSSVSPVPAHSDSKLGTKSIRRYREHQLFSLPVVFPFASGNKSFDCAVKCAKEEKKGKEKGSQRYWRASKTEGIEFPDFLEWNKNCSLTLKKLPNFVLKKTYCKVP